MSIIGMIASEKQTKQIRKDLEQEENLKVEVVCINSNSIENVKNIKFEILIIQDSLEKFKENIKYLEAIFKNTKYLLLNTDININKKFFDNIKVQILTYGLKQKATLTVSGIEEKIIISMQRAFKNLNGNIVEQQEISKGSTKNGTKDLYNSLIKIAIINILGGENR